VKFHVHMLVTCRIYLNHDSDCDRNNKLLYVNYYDLLGQLAAQIKKKHTQIKSRQNTSKYCEYKRIHALTYQTINILQNYSTQQA